MIGSSKRYDSPSQEIDICVVGGAGHVGLPLAIFFASKGCHVHIYDINEAVLEIISQGKVPFVERGAEPLLQQVLADGLLTMSTDPTHLKSADTIILTIGTPVDEFLNPVLTQIKRSVDKLLPYLSKGQLIILRSTVSPGTTEWLQNYLDSKKVDVKIAFCPERIVEGYALEELQQFPQIISGTTPEAEEAARKVFSLIVPEVVRLTPLEAEFAKLFTNSYRYIQFAAANQFYMIAEAAGVDYHRVLAGMKKDYHRARDIPRAGFAAGPCLLKDTLQLAAVAQNNFALGHAAMNTNEGLVLYLIDRLSRKYELENCTVGLLGMAFKADSDDIRSSLSYKLKKMLAFKAKEILTTDPLVTTDPTLLPLEEVIDKSDVLILCTPHSAYKNLDPKGKTVIDICNYLENGSLI